MNVSDLYRRIGQLELELAEQKRINQSLAERCHGQAEALAKAAEKTSESPAAGFTLPKQPPRGMRAEVIGPAVVDGLAVPAGSVLVAVELNAGWSYELWSGPADPMCAPAKMD